MPALPNVPSVLKAQLMWSVGSLPQVTSTLYYAYSGGAPDSANASNLATVIGNAFGAHDGLWSNQNSLQSTKVTDLTSNSGAVGEATTNFGGGDTSPALNGSAAVCVNYAINRRYRGGKPRNYFPWGTADDLATQQSWSGTFLTAVAAAMSAISSVIIGTSEGPCTISNHVNVSYYQGFTVEGGTGGKRAKNVSTPRAAPLVDNIVAYSVLARPASQRKRNI